jgi:hypothetical protein
MARSRITSASQDLISDNGAVLASIVDGEQIQLDVTLNWVTNLSGYQLKVTVIEALNTGDGKIPTAVQPSGVITQLPILDATITDNTFKIVFPENLIATWTTQPSPDKPVYGYIELEVKDTGTGNLQQIWKPLRGLVEVLYSPTEF